MAHKPKAKTKKLLIDLENNTALVITDDGLIDQTDEEAEWRFISEEGDRTVRDYADYDMAQECD